MCLYKRGLKDRKDAADLIFPGNVSPRDEAVAEIYNPIISSTQGIPFGLLNVCFFTASPIRVYMPGSMSLVKNW
jgi:hypothetical protein